jgi:small subunit ribosomal protein S13
MSYLLGINIPEQHLLYIGLTKIYGINKQTSQKICFALGLNKLMRFNALTNAQLAKIQKFISTTYNIQTLLKKEKNLNIQRLIDNKSYRGKRHILNLPVRGQRTRSNAQTVKKAIK